MMHTDDRPLPKDEQASLRKLEESLWRAETRFDNRLMDRIFAPDFFEFGRSGQTYTRDQMLFDPAEKREIKAKLPLKDFRARRLSEDVVQITYVSEVERDNIIEKSNRSSIWSYALDGWVLRFHQGTPCP